MEFRHNLCLRALQRRQYYRNSLNPNHYILNKQIFKQILTFVWLLSSKPGSLVIPRRPASPNFLKTWCAGNISFSSHSSTNGLTSLSIICKTKQLINKIIKKSNNLRLFWLFFWVLRVVSWKSGNDYLSAKPSEESVETIFPIIGVWFDGKTPLFQISSKYLVNKSIIWSKVIELWDNSSNDC